MSPESRPGDRGQAADRVWAGMLGLGSLTGVAVCVVIALLGWVVSGREAAGSAVVGAVIVAVVFALSLVALWWASRHAAPVAPLVMLILYVGLVAAGGMILLSTGAPRWVAPAWIGTATIAQMIAWLGAMSVALWRGGPTMPRRDTSGPDTDALEVTPGNMGG